MYSDIHPQIYLGGCEAAVEFCEALSEYATLKWLQWQRVRSTRTRDLLRRIGQGRDRPGCPFCLRLEADCRSAIICKIED